MILTTIQKKIHNDFVITKAVLITSAIGYTTDYCDKKLCLRYKHGEYVYEHNIGCDVNYVSILKSSQNWVKPS